MKRCISVYILLRFSLALGCGAVAALGPVAAAAKSATGSYLAARHASAINDLDAAATYYTRALALDPENVRLMEQTVLFKVASGDVSGAVPVARVLVEKNPRHRIAQLVLASSAIAKGRTGAARDRLEEHGATAFNIITEKLLGGWAAFSDGETAAALETFRSLEGQQLYRIFGEYHAALAASLNGDSDAADAAFASALGDGAAPNARLAEAYGRFLEREGRAPEAADLYEKALERLPGDPLLQTALKRARAGETPPPLLVGSAREGAAEALFGLAGAFARDDGGVRLSLVYVQLALFLAPEMDAAKVLLGNVVEAQERWEEAARIYGEIPEDSPYFRVAQVGRAEALGRSEQVDDALATLRMLEDRFPDDVSLPIARGDLLRRFERYAEAERAYNQALSMIETPQDRHWSLFYARGVCRERIGAWDEAEADLKKALEFRPNQAHVLNYLGYSWIEQGRNLTEAREMIERAVAMRPDDGYITDSLGWVHYRLGDYEAAVDTLERAVELNPTDPVINDHFGDALWMVGRKLEAEFQWRRALSFDPEEEGLRERILRKLDVGLDVVRAEEERTAVETGGGLAGGGDATPEESANGPNGG